MPGFTVTNSYPPSWPVVRATDTPVSVLVRVTFASGTVAPDASFTVPTTDAVSNCAEAGAAAKRRRSITPTRARTADQDIEHLRRDCGLSGNADGSVGM